VNLRGTSDSRRIPLFRGCSDFAGRIINVDARVGLEPSHIGVGGLSRDMRSSYDVDEVAEPDA
jgi:hypothetical protein